MDRIKYIVDFIYDKLNNGTDDCVYIIAGKEGSGKSNLALHILDYWLRKKYGKVQAKDIKYINLDLEKWAECLNESNEGDAVVLDEGGQISNKRSMSKLNVAIEQAYQISRAHRIFTILCIPSLFLLDSFFSTHRAKGMFYVYEKGKVMWFSKEKLEITVVLNQFRKLKKETHATIPRDCFDNYSIYTGVLKDPYDKLKKKFISKTFGNLLETIKSIKSGGDDPIDEKIKELRDNGYDTKSIAEEIGLSRTTVGKRLSKIKRQELQT